MFQNEEVAARSRTLARVAEIAAGRDTHIAAFIKNFTDPRSGAVKAVNGHHNDLMEIPFGKVSLPSILHPSCDRASKCVRFSCDSLILIELIWRYFVLIDFIGPRSADGDQPKPGLGRLQRRHQG